MCLFDLYTWLFILKEVKSIPVFSWFPRSLHKYLFLSRFLFSQFSLAISFNHLFIHALWNCLPSSSHPIFSDPHSRTNTLTPWEDYQMSHQSMHNRAPTTIPLCPYQVGCACSPPRLKICEPLTVSKIVYPATFGNIVFWFFLIL